MSQQERFAMGLHLWLGEKSREYPDLPAEELVTITLGYAVGALAARKTEAEIVEMVQHALAGRARFVAKRKIGDA